MGICKLSKETNYDSLNKLLFIIIGFILILHFILSTVSFKKMNEELNEKIK